jgi:hypothetical protein
MKQDGRKDEGRKESGENGENRIEGRMKKVDETGWVILSSCFVFFFFCFLFCFCVCDDLLSNNPQSIKLQECFVSLQARNALYRSPLFGNL